MVAVLAGSAQLPICFDTEPGRFWPPRPCCSGRCSPPARSASARSMAGKRSPPSRSISQLSGPPDSNSDWIKKGGSVTNAAGWRFAMARKPRSIHERHFGSSSQPGTGFMPTKRSRPSSICSPPRDAAPSTVAPFLLNILRARICYALSNSRVLRLVQNAMDHPRR